VTAVVLAGGAPDIVAALAPGVANKAFVPIGGVPLVERVLQTLRAVPRVERIVVVAPQAARDVPALALADERRDDGTRMIESLQSGLAGFTPDESVLIVASDMPVLTRAALDEAIDEIERRDLDIAYCVLERRYHVARYPKIPHTWAKMRDGSFCGGGVSSLKPRVLPRLADLLDSLGAARKSPVRLAGIFGWDFLLRFALGRLSIEAAEGRASKLVGAPVGAIRCTHPEIAVNVDRPGDVALAEGLVAGALA